MLPKKLWEQIVGGFFFFFRGLYGSYSSGEWAIVAHCDFLVGVSKELLHGSMLSFHTDAALLRAGSIEEQRICSTGWLILSSAFDLNEQDSRLRGLKLERRPPPLVKKSAALLCLRPLSRPSLDGQISQKTLKSSPRQQHLAVALCLLLWRQCRHIAPK